MTRQTFFNKGVYLSTLKRFWVGSALFLLLLFLITNLCLYDYDWDYDESWFESMKEFSMLFAFAVPVVVAMLVYKFAHSKKNSVFTHSLPVTRRVNYISTLLGAFTLMAAPVVVNGIIIMFSTRQTILSFEWVLFTLFALFAMFSVSTFAAFLTGSSWAVVVITILIHGLPGILGMFMEALLTTFAAGYAETSWSIADFIMGLNMPNFLQSLAFINSDLKSSAIVVGIMGAVAIVLYVVSYFLYKKRHMEKCEDVASFKVLNPIFKYLVAIIAVIFGFTSFGRDIDSYGTSCVITIAILSFIGYFGTEMLLKKKVKIWGAYKGYIVFAVVCCIFFGFMAGSSLFGFETYIPDADDVEYILLSDRRYGSDSNNNITDKDAVALLMEIHKELIASERENIVNDYKYDGYRITYNLKNDKEVTRWYGMDYSQMEETFARLYELENFKKQYEDVFNIPEENLWDIEIENYHLDKDERAEFLECIKADILDNGYYELYDSPAWANGYIEYLVKVDDEFYKQNASVPMGYTTYIERVQLNVNFVKSVNWLVDHGYGDMFVVEDEAADDVQQRQEELFKVIELAEN